MSAERIYIGNGKQNAGSEYINFTICFDDILEALHTNSFTLNGRIYFNATIAKKRTEAFGKSHTIYVPVRKTEAERLQELHDSIADQQEMEVRAHDEANC